MRQTFRLGKKQKVAKMGYAVLIENSPGESFRQASEVFPSKYLAEQYYHQKLATSHTIRKYRIVGVRMDVSPREVVRNQLK